jgi:Methyltransferase domain
VTGRPPAGAGGGDSCRACGSAELQRRVVSRPDKKRRLRAVICGPCGHVALPENVHDYTRAQSTADFGLKPRVGTEEVPGREFGMAQLGVASLHRSDLDVLVYGAGRSKDNLHIAGLPGVATVAIGDVARVRDEADFVDIKESATRTFDLVIASEVIEHFVQPRDEFPRLFGFVAPLGLLICSTNINDGGPLEKQAYIWGRGHTSYYTPEALRTLAGANGFQVDFRVPIAALGQGSPRKRYVIFSRSSQVMEAISDFFGRTMYAPSEEAVVGKRAAKQRVKSRAKRVLGRP